MRLNAEVGFNRTADGFAAAYSHLQDNEIIGLTVTLPIFDWGVQKGKVMVAKSNLELAKTKKEQAGSEKGKLLPTDIGIVVNDFLMANFPNIMDYNFTANVEQKFDDIAEGKTEWTKWMKEHKAGERELGKDPKSGRPVFVKIGRFGPVVQIGTAEDKDKPQFAQLPADKSIETITLEEALELFKLPRQVGEFEGTTVTIGSGRFGPYNGHYPGTGSGSYQRKTL